LLFFFSFSWLHNHHTIYIFSSFFRSIELSKSILFILIN
jgi:hypothetical protein